jgi:hypothetical protein
MAPFFMTALAFAGLARLIFALSATQSPPPLPTPTAAGQEQQEIRRNEGPQSAQSDTPSPMVAPVLNQSGSNPTTEKCHATGTKHCKESPFDYNALAVTIFTGIAALIAFLQWLVMRRQIDYIRVDQRAWLAAYDIRGIPKANEIYDISIDIKNTGKTFAKNFWINPVVAPRKKGVIPNFADEEARAVSDPGQGGFISKTFLPPGGSTTVKITVSPKLTAKDVTNFMSGEMAVWVFGKISYDDVFKCPHWTTFCSVLTLTARGIWEYSTYSEFNETDENDSITAK